MNRIGLVALLLSGCVAQVMVVPVRRPVYLVERLAVVAREPSRPRSQRCFSVCDALDDDRFVCYYSEQAVCRGYERDCVDTDRVSCVPLMVNLGEWAPNRSRSEWTRFYYIESKPWGEYSLEKANN